MLGSVESLIVQVGLLSHTPDLRQRDRPEDQHRYHCGHSLLSPDADVGPDQGSTQGGTYLNVECRLCAEHGFECIAFTYADQIACRGCGRGCHLEAFRPEMLGYVAGYAR
jgi:hypothetical protein